MAKRHTAEERLSALTKLRGGPLTPEALELLRGTLADKTSFFVAKAAKLAGEMNATALTPELVAAFNRLIDHPGSDKGCEAMSAIVEALKIFGAGEPELYLRGIRHVQMEAGWGEWVDVATRLRSQSAFALVRIGYRDVLWHLSTLLADPQRDCRLAAARSIGACGADAGLPLLKFKVLASLAEDHAEDEEEIAGECLSAMTELNATKAIPFVAAYLDHDDERIVESAALALGTTRRPEALAALKERVDRRGPPGQREMMLLAIATLRIEPAIAYLLSLVAQADARGAGQAIKALAVYRRDDVIRTRVGEAVAARNDAVVRQAYEKEFG
jgi:HEAT repeat protein